MDGNDSNKTLRTQLKLPTKQSMARVLEVCGGNSDLLRYARNDVHYVIKACRAESEMESMLTALDDTISAAKIREARVAAVDPWEGPDDEAMEIKAPNALTDADTAAIEEIEELDESSKEKLVDITMFYDIDANSNFARGYLSNGVGLNPKNEDDKKVISSADRALQAWLVHQGLRNVESEGKGVIYYAKPVDKNNNPIKKVEPERFNELLSNPKTSLQKTSKLLDQSLNISVYHQSAEATKTPDLPAPE